MKDEYHFVIHGDSAMQMFHWMSPFIAKAGYSWTYEPKKDSFGAWDIKIRKVNIQVK